MPKNKTDNFLKAIKKYAKAQKNAMEGEVKQLKTERLAEAEAKAKRDSDRLKKEKLNARLILQVHDELIVECPEAEAERVQALLEEEMENAVHYSVPLIAEAHIGHSWAEAH